MRAALVLTFVLALQSEKILGEEATSEMSQDVSSDAPQPEMTSLAKPEPAEPNEQSVTLPETRGTKGRKSTVRPTDRSDSESGESESSEEDNVRNKRQDFGSILGFQDEEGTTSPEEEDEDEDEDDDYDISLSDLLDLSSIPILGSLLAK